LAHRLDLPGRRLVLANDGFGRELPDLADTVEVCDIVGQWHHAIRGRRIVVHLIARERRGMMARRQVGDVLLELSCDTELGLVPVERSHGCISHYKLLWLEKSRVQS